MGLPAKTQHKQRLHVITAQWQWAHAAMTSCTALLTNSYATPAASCLHMQAHRPRSRSSQSGQRPPQPHGGDSPQLALGSCFTYFRHPFLRRRFFVDPNLREFFATVLQPETLAIHGSVAGRLRPTGAWGRWPAGIFSICIRINGTSNEARATRLSVVRRIGRHSADWARHRESALRTDDEQNEPF